MATAALHLCGIGPQSHSSMIIGSMVQLFLPVKSGLGLIEEQDWVLDKTGSNLSWTGPSGKLQTDIK